MSCLPPNELRVLGSLVSSSKLPQKGPNLHGDSRLQLPSMGSGVQTQNQWGRPAAGRAAASHQLRVQGVSVLGMGNKKKKHEDLVKKKKQQSCEEGQGDGFSPLVQQDPA